MSLTVSAVLRHLRRVSIVLLAAAVAAGCNAEATNPTTAKRQAVETMTVGFEPGFRTASYAGTVKPRYQSDLGFRVAGKIVERLIEVGSVVTKGQVIARLDPSDFQLALAAQQAELQAAETSSEEAAASLARFEALLEKGHVARAAVDQRTSAAAEARSRVERAERSVELARNQLAYATLVSDSDGVVTALPVEAGQVIAAGQLVARVARRDAIEVEVALPEQDLDIARRGTAVADFWGDVAPRVPVELREVAPDADPVSRTFRARFALSEITSAPALGRTASIHLTLDTGGSVAALPLSAIANEGGASVVWVVSPDGTRALPRPVTIKSLEKDRALISSGLNAGERIVAFGVHMLDTHKPIRPVETRAQFSQK